MLEVFGYWLLQALGYRLFCFDWALSRGIPLKGYSAWMWRPWLRRGTYREQSPRMADQYKWAGYGVDA